MVPWSVADILYPLRIWFCLCCSSVRAEASIENKELVASLKKEYESMQFGDIKGEDLSKINADLDLSVSNNAHKHDCIATSRHPHS